MTASNVLLSGPSSHQLKSPAIALYKSECFIITAKFSCMVCEKSDVKNPETILDWHDFC